MNTKPEEELHQFDIDDYIEWRIDQHLSFINKYADQKYRFNAYLKSKGRPSRKLSLKSITRNNMLLAKKEILKGVLDGIVYLCKCPVCDHITTTRFCHRCREYTLTMQPLEYESDKQKNAFVAIISKYTHDQDE